MDGVLITSLYMSVLGGVSTVLFAFAHLQAIYTVIT